MFQDTPNTLVRTDRRGWDVALAVTILALSVAAVALPAAAQSDEPTVRVVGDTVETDGTTTVRVVLSTAPEGLSGYNLELSVQNPDVAHIEGGNYPETFGLTTGPEVDPDGRTVTLEAADLDGNVEPGASNVTLATVEIAGDTAGDTTVTIESARFDDDSGNPLDPAVRSATVTVTDGDQAETAADETGTATGEPTSTSAGGESDGTPTAAGGTPNGGTPGASGDLPVYVPIVALGVALAAALLGGRS